MHVERFVSFCRDRERRIREFGDRGSGLGASPFEKSLSTTTSSWVNAEMGIGDDGSFSGHPGILLRETVPDV